MGIPPEKAALLVRLFRPGVKLLDLMRYPLKMAFLGTVFSLPIAVFLFLLLSHINTSIDRAEKERLGLVYNRSVAELLQDVQQHRGLASAFISGDVTFKKRLDAMQARIKGHILALDNIDAELGPKLKTTPGWNTLKNRWLVIQANLSAMDAEKSFEAHTSLISGILELMRHVADITRLTLDPGVISSYYLMETMVDTIPLAVEYSGRIRGIGMGAVVSGALTPRQEARLVELSVLNRSMLEKVERNLARVFDENPDTVPLLEPSMRRALTAGERALEKLESEVISPNGITITPRGFFDLFTGAIDAGFGLHREVGSALDRILDARIEGLEKRKYYLWAGALATVLVLVYLFVGNYFSIMNSVSSLVDASRRIGRGELAVTISPESKDEMALVAESFNDMARSLAGYMAELREANVALRNEIAERRQAEEAARESEERYRVIAETAPDAILTIDEESTIVFANPAVEKIFGYPPGEVVGKNITFLMPGRHRENHLAAMKRYLDTGKRKFDWKAVELRGLHRSGREIPLEISYGVFTTRGRRMFSGVVRDITERMEAEKEKEYQNMLERFNRELETLVAERTTSLLAMRLADSVRTPAAVIEWTGRKIIEKGSEYGKIREDVEDLIEEAGKLESTVKEFQELIKSRHAVFSYEDINGIVRDVLFIIEKEAAIKGVEVVEGLSSAPLKINAQKDLLRMAVFTMLRNAVESAPEGGGRVTVSTSEDGPNVVLAISDNGPGIPGDILPGIFDPSYSARVYRFGMGLPLIKQIVSEHLGEITVESGEGKGTTFRVAFPERWMEKA